MVNSMIFNNEFLSRLFDAKTQGTTWLRSAELSWKILIHSFVASMQVRRVMNSVRIILWKKAALLPA